MEKKRYRKKIAFITKKKRKKIIVFKFFISIKRFCICNFMFNYQLF